MSSSVKEEARPTRIGFLADGDPNTDLMTAVYEFDASGVRLQVPFLSRDDIRSRWWSQGVAFGDDPDRSRFSYSPPSELNYFDHKGSVALLGCASGAWSSDILNGVGTGTIRARYSVEKARRRGQLREAQWPSLGD